ncbi:hypothetical protein [Phenylobacterium sp.]|jgi:glycosyltransferase involved in cell wall biosynthesis|uniref:hypothetical protein n=1 Tax=Phenylobacterium sp. TaxID=1871053 RepID=UPI0037CC0C15
MKARIEMFAARLGWKATRPELDPDSRVVARAFDRAFYLTRYPDVAASGADPLEHFMAHGWHEGRDPNPDFSVLEYLAAFPDIAASGANPFLHHLTHGRPKTAPQEAPLGFRFELIEGLTPIEVRLARLQSINVPLLPEDDLYAVLSTAPDGLARVHVTFSQDNYATNTGGLQFTIRREAARLAELGRDHLHLHGARPWTLVRGPDDVEALAVVWNGQPLGAVSPDTLRRVLAFVANDDASGRSFAIHSLLGHAPDEVADILAALGLRQGVFWLHDFASLCAGFHLLRNEVEDCGAPPPGSAACNVCLFGPWRDRHIQGHARLFERLDLQVAAPSRSALDLWRRATKLPATGTHVLPHARLMPLGPSPIPPARRPFLIAYAGFPAPHKGWAIFRNLAARFGQDPRYEFIHLGAHPDLAMPHRFERVEAVADNPQAMKMALEAVQADAVLVWPLCRETFSFVAYEAAAAGCAVITGPDSGNVAAFVRERGHGQVIDNEAELAAAFETGTILQLARAERRPMLYDLVYSALTLDLATSSSP